jgi:uncharacterized protein (DUF1684 family)
MQRCLLFVVILYTVLGCQQDKQPLLGDTPFQRKMNAEFKDATTSPLEPNDLKEFRALDFFPYDSSFMVRAKLKRTPDAEWFQMKTTTDRLSKERVYGVLSFSIEGQPYTLKVYQGEEEMNTPGSEDFLFLPFLDLTNGESTYGGGRYINLRIPPGDTLVVDFNEAYNPYCVYSEKYSCPIVPRENFLNLKVKAGLKMYRKTK